MRRQKVERKGAGGHRDGGRRFAYRHVMRLLLLLLLLPLALAGCGRVTDLEQLRLCRLILPVLHPEGTDIREIRVGPAPVGRSGVRIDYWARGPGAGSKAHFAACGFGGTTFERDRLDLVAVETDEGALGEARLLYLKRFWLSEAEREGVAPPAPEVPQIPAAAAYALQQLVNALALAAVYALLATAYSLIYGLVGRINLGLRRDRSARCLWGNWRGRGGGRAWDWRCHHRPCTRLRARCGDLCRLERAGGPRRGRAAARTPSPRPADPDRNGCGRAVRAGVSPHLARRTRAMDAAHVQSADRACARAGFHRDGDANADRGGLSRPCGSRRRPRPARPHALRPRLARFCRRSGERPLCSASMEGGFSPRPSCSPVCSRASPDGSWRPTTATSRFRWARCSD